MQSAEGGVVDWRKTVKVVFIFLQLQNKLHFLRGVRSGTYSWAFYCFFFFAFAVFSSQINTKRPIHHMYTIRLVLFCAFVLRLLIFHMHTHSGCYSLSFLRWWLRLRGVVESQRKIRARKTGCRKLKEEDCCGVLERCDGDGFLGGSRPSTA